MDFNILFVRFVVILFETKRDHKFILNLNVFKQKVVKNLTKERKHN